MAVPTIISVNVASPMEPNSPTTNLPSMVTSELMSISPSKVVIPVTVTSDTLKTPTVATPVLLSVMLAKRIVEKPTFSFAIVAIPETLRSLVLTRLPTVTEVPTTTFLLMNTSEPKPTLSIKVDRPMNVDAPVTVRSVTMPIFASKLSTAKTVATPVLTNNVPMEATPVTSALTKEVSSITTVPLKVVIPPIVKLRLTFKSPFLNVDSPMVETPRLLKPSVAVRSLAVVKPCESRRSKTVRIPICDCAESS